MIHNLEGVTLLVASHWQGFVDAPGVEGGASETEPQLGSLKVEGERKVVL